MDVSSAAGVIAVLIFIAATKVATDRLTMDCTATVLLYYSDL